MQKPSQYIVDVCPACHIKGQHEYTGESGEYMDCDVLVSEHLYRCCNCKEKIWIDEYCIKPNSN